MTSGGMRAEVQVRLAELRRMSADKGKRDWLVERFGLVAKGAGLESV